MSVMAWLPADIVRAFEALAAARDVSRVARHRPAAGGWLAATRRTAEYGQEPDPREVRKAIQAAETEIGHPFEDWAAESHGRRLDGVNWPLTPFVDNGGQAKPGYYGFMAFHDWLSAKGLDPARWIDGQGHPTDRIETDLRSPSRARLVRWWLDNRRAFVARHAAQLAGSAAFETDGRPTRRHLGLIMWAASPASPAALRKVLRG